MVKILKIQLFFFRFCNVDNTLRTNEIENGTAEMGSQLKVFT